jgi:hypothetical protein
MIFPANRIGRRGHGRVNARRRELVARMSANGHFTAIPPPVRTGGPNIERHVEWTLTRPQRNAIVSPSAP